MRGQKLEKQHNRQPEFLLTLDRDDISALLDDRAVSCIIPGTIDRKPIDLAVYGVQGNVVMQPWFEAQVYGKTPFYLFAPSDCEAALRVYLTREAFELRTDYCGTMASAYVKFLISSA